MTVFFRIHRMARGDMTESKAKPYDDKESRIEAIRTIHEKLKQAWADEVEVPRRKTLDELVFNLLLQGSSKERAERAFEALKEEFHDWNEVRVTLPSTIVEVIKGVGLESLKAMRLVKILQGIFEDRSEVDLEFLREMEPKAVSNYLGNMEGIGGHAVESVLAFSLDRHVFPLTKAAERFAERFGLVEGKNAGRDFKNLVEEGVPEGEMPLFIVLLDHHNQVVCRADRPKCSKCPLASDCLQGRKAAERSRRRKSAAAARKRSRK